MRLLLILLAFVISGGPTGILAQGQEPHGRFGMPIEPPSETTKESTYGFLKGAPSVKIVEPGRFEVTFETEEPTPPAVLSGGANTLDEELDYPRFHYFCGGREDGEVTDLRTEHSITADFSSIKRRLPNTPYEPRVTYRVEVYIPSFRATRFFEGRVYFNPETLGDATNVTFGPTVEQVTPNTAVIAWETDREVPGEVRVVPITLSNGVYYETGQWMTFRSNGVGIRHETKIEGMNPGAMYRYQVVTGDTTVRPYEFSTPGDWPIRFAAMVDSREGNGSGMNNFGGVNGASLYSLGTDLYFRGTDFVVFAGDLINGYTTSPDDYRNQLNAFRWIMGPVHARIPIYEGMGNHEALLTRFDDGSRWGVTVDRLGEENSETVFADAFVNPTNGPKDEGEGSPSYDETVYYFDYGPVRVFMLNNNYWFSSDPYKIGGNLEGYILPNQVEWLREEVAKANDDDSVEYIFFAAQEPPFPNGGHTRDAMWYRSGDTNRDGKVDDKDIPIVKNRNTIWEIVSSSPKSVAFITGDEHAYSRLIVTNETDIGSRTTLDGTELEMKYPVWQITSGGAGAPWYDKELDLPWSPNLKTHSTQPHYAFFTLDRENVTVEAYSQTGQRIDHAMLRKDGKNTKE
ncbi:metallophosphoesterase [bacterium]|nr:metallophosphoesterase [bacterium]